MNKNINLTKILKDCPKGWKFWSPFLGEVEFDSISKIRDELYVKVNKDGRWYFNADGTITMGNITSQIIMLCPSKEQQDWSKFTAPWLKKERFDPKTLKPFDRVLVKDSHNDIWYCKFFSHIMNVPKLYNYATTGGFYKYCIPYNDDTKHLVGTNEEAPEFYRYWED